MRGGAEQPARAAHQRGWLTRLKRPSPFGSARGRPAAVSADPALTGKTGANHDAEEDMNSISAVAESNGHAPAALPSRERPWPTGRRPVDRVAVQRAARDLLVALGADLETEGLRETPRRMAAAYAELLTPEPFSLTTFPNDEGYDELVVVRDIPFESLCMHHVLPFHGVSRLLPAGRAHRRPLEARTRGRAVRPRSPAAGAAHDADRRLPADQLQPKGVGVVIEAEHLCVSLRGVQKHGAKTVTSTLYGLVRDDPRTRGEFLSLTGGRTA